jgi:hypothetical protein
MQQNKKLKNTKTRGLVLFLILITISLMVVSCEKKTENFITSGTCGDNLTWQFNDNGTLTISGNGAMGDYWFQSAPWFPISEKIKTIIIDDGVTTVGSWAFDRCYNLTSVELPNSITIIKYNAFCFCRNLKSMQIPNTVTSIGNYAFRECKNLTSLEIPNSVTFIGTLAFYGCSGLTSLSISSSVTTIKEHTFAYCSNLTSLEIPNSVITIGGEAFAYCQKLASVIIPNSVVTIGGNAFYYNNLTIVEIPNSVISIGISAFSACNNLISINVNVDNPNYSSNDGVLYNKSQDILLCYPGGKAGIVTIPNSVTTIGSNAFSHCEKLTSVIIPNSVTKIENASFSNCKGLTLITIGNSVTMIGNYAFGGCSNLKSIICKTTSPPDIVIYNNEPGISTFEGVPTNIPVSVPCQTLSSYKNSNWEKVFSKINEDC